MIAGTVEAKDLQGFMFVVCGALGAGRRVDARHLHHGAMLIPDEKLLVAMAWHTEGDVAGNLVAAVRDTLMPPERFSRRGFRTLLRSVTTQLQFLRLAVAR